MGSSVVRLEKLRAAYGDAGMDAFFARDTANIRWLTGFDGVFDAESAHALVVTREAAVLHTDSRYAAACERAAAAAGGIVTVDASRQTHASWLTDAVPTATRRIGIEDDISLAEFRRLEASSANLVETSGLVRGLRAVKDADEIARMREAQAITDKAFSYIVGFMRPGMTEREVQIELEGFMLRNGAEGLAFSSIVAAGANGANPHAVPGAAKLEAGQCVVLDFGAVAQGYCSDMTRTVFLGEPEPEMRAAYETIRRANEEVQAALHPGVTGRAMHEMAERILEEGGFGGAMGHGLGHGVGLEVHEEPSLSPRNDAPLRVGNVVTVEPGIYLPGRFGMRLEDFGVVTSTGFDRFTRSTHDLVVL